MDSYPEIKDIKNAQILPKEIDYINAHSTSTNIGDLVEIRAIKNLLKKHINKTSISSTKSATGHTLGGAGGIEAILSMLSTFTNIVPPTINLYCPDNECLNIDLVPNKPKKKYINISISNSFGFGGTNSSLVFKKFTT